MSSFISRPTPNQNNRINLISTPVKWTGEVGLALLEADSLLSAGKIIPYTRNLTAAGFTSGTGIPNLPAGFIGMPCLLPMLEQRDYPLHNDTNITLTPVMCYEIGSVNDKIDFDFPVRLQNIDYVIEGEKVQSMGHLQRVLLRIHKNVGVKINWVGGNIENNGLSDDAISESDFLSFIVERRVYNNGSEDVASNHVVEWITPNFFYKSLNELLTTAKNDFVSIINELKEGGVFLGAAAGGDLTGNYPNPQIANKAVTTEKIANKAVTTEKIANDAVTSRQIAYYAVTSKQIADQEVTTRNLRNNAVTTEKIDDNAVTTEKLADHAVTSRKIGTQEIVTRSLVNNSVTTEKIADNAVTTEKIANYYLPSRGRIGKFFDVDKIIDKRILPINWDINWWDQFPVGETKFLKYGMWQFTRDGEESNAVVCFAFRGIVNHAFYQEGHQEGHRLVADGFFYTNTDFATNVFVLRGFLMGGNTLLPNGSFKGPGAIQGNSYYLMQCYY